MAPPRSSSLENSLQAFIHSIEQGRLLPLMQKIILAVVLLAVGLDYLGWKFRGFALPEAMDQAQAAREFSRGRGWSTRFIRPLAIWQIEKNFGSPPREATFPDTFNAPLPPVLNALPVLLGGDVTKFKRGELIAPAERLIAMLAMLCFVAAVGVQYLLLRRYFDERLAFWASVFTLLSDFCWEFTLSGLPQMAMLLLFNLTLYALARAIETQRAASLSQDAGNAGFRPAEVGPPAAGTAVQANAPAPGAEAAARARAVSHAAPLRWLAVAGVLFGLLALSHALAVWLLVGAVAFSAFYFRRRAAAAGVLLVMFALVYTPWLVRNYRVSGSAFGLAGYAIFDGIDGGTEQRMRSTDTSRTETVSPYFFRPKVQGGIVTQLRLMSQNLGGNLLTLMFFAALLHSFRRPEVSALRWAVLLMWLAAVLGMALIGNAADTPAVSANQLGVLFLPIMLGYGLAFVLVLFARLEFSTQPLSRLVLFSVLLLVSGVPMLFRLLPEQHPPYQYPPYLEPVIALLNGWTEDKEVIASDMPWAVAWYADRKSLWIPDKYRDLMALSDNGKLSGPLAGLFISPVSRGLPYNGEIYKGGMQEYAPLILGSTNVPYFPFHEVAAPMGDLSYIFYSDTRRWEKKKRDEG